MEGCQRPEYSNVVLEYSIVLLEHSQNVLGGFDAERRGLDPSGTKNVEDKSTATCAGDLTKRKRAGAMMAEGC